MKKVRTKKTMPVIQTNERNKNKRESKWNQLESTGKKCMEKKTIQGGQNRYPEEPNLWCRTSPPSTAGEYEGQHGGRTPLPTGHPTIRPPAGPPPPAEGCGPSSPSLRWHFPSAQRYYTYIHTYIYIYMYIYTYIHTYTYLHTYIR